MAESSAYQLQKISRGEERIVWLFAVVLFAVMAVGSVLRWHEGQMDTTLPVQITENIATRGEAVFQEVGLRQIFKNLTLPVEDVCNQPLKAPERKEDSMFDWHTYLILYLIAPLSWLVPAEVLIPALTALCFVAMLGFAYVMLRRRSIPVTEALLFTLVVACHPAWSWGLFGQAYVDRYFFGLGMLLLFLIDRPGGRALPLFFCALACCLVNDRLGLICGAFVVGYAVLNWRLRPDLRWKGLALGVFCGLFAFVLMKAVISNQFYGSFLSQLNPHIFLANLKNQAFADNLKIFFIFNLLFFGWFLFFDWKALILVFGVSIPNIFGTIGGAEKSGWSTHYHSNYFPILVWGALVGFAHFYELLPKRARRPVSVLVLAAMGICLAGFFPFAYSGFKFSTGQLKAQAIYRTVAEIPAYFDESVLQGKYRRFGEELEKLVPAGAKITLPESVMPLIYKERLVYYFPIGLPDADFALLPYTRQADGSLALGGAQSFLAYEEQVRLGRCLQARMKDEGYSMHRATIFDNGWALIPRKEHWSKRHRRGADGPGAAEPPAS